MTCPLTFSSPPFDWNLTNDEPRREGRAEDREKAEVARGSCGRYHVSFSHGASGRVELVLQILIAWPTAWLVADRQDDMCRSAGWMGKVVVRIEDVKELKDVNVGRR